MARRREHSEATSPNPAYNHPTNQTTDDPWPVDSTGHYGGAPPNVKMSYANGDYSDHTRRASLSGLVCCRQVIFRQANPRNCVQRMNRLRSQILAIWPSNTPLTFYP